MALGLVAMLPALHCGSGGIVGGSCLPELTACDHQCVDTTSDAAHCGGCGNQCEADERCLVGACVRTPGVLTGSDAGLDPLDGGVTELPDGRILPPGSGGSGPGGDECGSLLGTAEHCSACNVPCEGPTPYCARTSSGNQCVAACSDELSLCGAECVDLETDVDHCGDCGEQCPTAICIDGACVGATAGHVVLLCMNYESGQSFSAQTTLLSNAVFLSSRQQVRVMGFAQYARSRVIAGVERAMAWSDDENGRGILLTQVTSSEPVREALSRRSQDVLFVYDQALAPGGALAQLGSEWRDLLSNFTVSGGVVVVSMSSDGAAGMHEFVAAAGLMDGVTGATDATDTIVYNREPSDAVGLNVFSQFRLLRSSCTFDLAASPSNASWIVTDQPPGQAAPLGAPVVLHAVAEAR